MAIMELLVRGTYRGKPNLNRWHYISSGTPAAVSLSFALTYAFGAIEVGTPPAFPSGTMFAAMRAMQSTLFVYQEVQARDMYSDLDFYTRPFPSPVTGSVNDIGASPFESIGFYTNRVRQSIGRGYKRIGGIVDSMFQTEGRLSSSGIATATALAAEMGSPLVYDDEGNPITFTPCVLQFEEYTTPKGNRAYKPYATAAAQLDHAAQGVIWGYYNEARSQVSRQV